MLIERERTMKTMKLAVWAAAGALLVSSAVATTTFTNYGDFAAADVDFLQVQEHTTNPGDTVPKYGSPNVSAAGNGMDFNPVGFSAIAENGSSDVTDGNLVFTAAARGNMAIEQIGFAERGNYNLGGTGTDATYVDVDAYFYIEVTEVNYNPIEAFGIPVWMQFSTNTDGTYELVTDGAGGGMWFGSLQVDINAALVENGYSASDRATRVDVDLNNVLTAFSEDGTSSLIAKKDFDVGFTVDIIPEPASAVMLAGASALIAFVRRRFVG
jgi:hypothetical protein